MKAATTSGIYLDKVVGGLEEAKGGVSDHDEMQALHTEGPIPSAKKEIQSEPESVIAVPQ